MTRPHRAVTAALIVVLGCSLARGVVALTPNDPFFSRQWYLERIGAPAAWDETTGNARSVIAVIDVGVDLDHPDLRDAIWTNPDETPGNGVDDDQNGFVDDLHGWDFIDHDADPSPAYDVPGSDPRDLHHGTILAGIMAARGGNGEGIAGIDWRARIMPLRILHSDGSGDVGTVLRAFQYAVREGATIINLSFIGEDRSVDLDTAIADAAARGIVVVAAGGNEDRTGKGDLDRFPVYPICAGLDGANVLGVAATDEADAKAPFSSYGRCVDVAAPGDRIIGTTFHDPGHTIIRVAGKITTTTFDQPYGGFFAGTSFAAPIAAGAVSLLRDLLPRATPAELIALLRETADPVHENHVTAGRVGAGRVNLARAVATARAQIAAVPDARASRVTIATPLAGVGDAIVVRVELRSERGSPIPGRTVAVTPNRSSDVATPSTATTDSEGVATFMVRGGADGIAEFQAATDGVPLGSARTVFVAALTAPIGPGALLRGTTATVYAVGRDGKRYAFPDATTFRSWFADAAASQRVPDAVLSAFPLGGLIAIRPGTFLVKVQTDPKVYAVDRDAVLRWVPDEDTARVLFGAMWTQRVVDVPDAFFPTYRVGAPLTVAVHPSGALLEDARDGSRYLVVDGRRRRFESTLAFLQNGFQWRDVIRVLAVGYPDGDPITGREVGLAQSVP